MYFPSSYLRKGRLVLTWRALWPSKDALLNHIWTRHSFQPKGFYDSMNMRGLRGELSRTIDTTIQLSATVCCLLAELKAAPNRLQSSSPGYLQPSVKQGFTQPPEPSQTAGHWWPVHGEESEVNRAFLKPTPLYRWVFQREPHSLPAARAVSCPPAAIGFPRGTFETLLTLELKASTSVITGVKAGFVQGMFEVGGNLRS